MKINKFIGLVLVTMIFAGCTDNGLVVQDMVRMNHDLEFEGFDSEVVKPLIWESIQEEYAVAEDYEGMLEIMPMTTESIWSNAKAQIFYAYIPIPGVTFDGFAVYNHENELMELIAGVGAREVFSADLNKDGIYEIVINYSRDVNMPGRYVAVYDIKNDKLFRLGNQEEKKDMIAHINEEDNQIMIYSKLTTADIETEKYVGTLELDDSGLTTR